MAFFTRNKAAVGYQAAADFLKDQEVMGNLGNEESAKAIAGFSSLEALANNKEQEMVLEAAEARIEKVLKSEQVLGYIRTVAGLDADQTPENNHVLASAMSAMTQAAMAGGDAETYMNKYSKPSRATGDVTIEGTEDGFAMEGFDDFKFDEFKAASVLSAGLNMATSPFSQTFFKPVSIPGGQSGLDLRVQLPQIYARTIRENDGRPFAFEKHSLVRAALDSTILEANHTKIVPVGSADNATYLAPIGEIANRNVSVAGVEVGVRPILYGTMVNLIGISSTPRIIAMGAQTEMDTLDPYVSIGVQYIEISDTNGGGDRTAIIAADFTNMPGATLYGTPDGNIRNKATVFEGRFWVTNETENIRVGATGGTVGEDTQIDEALGLADGDAFRFALTVRLAATLEHERANMQVDFISAEASHFTSGANLDTPVATADVTAALATTAFDGSGWEPSARRSNSIMKDLATIVDSGTTYQWRLAVPMEAPISSLQPVTVMGGGVAMDTLSAVKRLRNLGTAATTLLNFETQMIATAGIPDANVAIGDVLVDSTYIHETIDLTAVVQTISSSQGLQDLQTHLVNAVTWLANQLIMQSNYRNALAVYTGNANNFEVNLVTDAEIANLLMTAGDGRTLGNGRRFSVTEIDDLRYRGEIYMTLSRTDVAGADVLNSGCHLSAPALIYKATTTRGQAVAGETQMLPREAFYMTLPILGRMSVTGLTNYFSQPIGA